MAAVPQVADRVGAPVEDARPVLSRLINEFEAAA
jgi:hypothetical protein